MPTNECITVPNMCANNPVGSVPRRATVRLSLPECGLTRPIFRPESVGRPSRGITDSKPFGQQQTEVCNPITQIYDQHKLVVLRAKRMTTKPAHHKYRRGLVGKHQSPSHFQCHATKVFIIICIRSGSSPSGSGKTHKIVHRACKLTRDHTRCWRNAPLGALGAKRFSRLRKVSSQQSY